MVVDILKLFAFFVAVYSIPLLALWMWNKESPKDE
jgi:hypothetical protein